MSAGFWKKLPHVRGCPRGVHLVSRNVADVVRACLRGEKNRGACVWVVRGCPRGVKVCESWLSAHVRLFFRFFVKNHAS